MLQNPSAQYGLLKRVSEWKMQDPWWRECSFCQNSDGAHGLCISQTTLEAGNSQAYEHFFSHHMQFVSLLGTKSFISRSRVDSWSFNNRVSHFRGIMWLLWSSLSPSAKLVFRISDFRGGEGKERGGGELLCYFSLSMYRFMKRRTKDIPSK